MKKTLLLIALAISIFYPAATYAQCGVFWDGFESNTWSPTWTAVGGSLTRSISTTNPAVGNYCFEQTGTNSHFEGSRATFTPSTPSSISYWVKSNSNTATNAYFVIGDASTTTNHGIFFCYLHSNGNIRVYSSSTDLFETPYTANAWNHIELRNIDFTAKTYDIYVNNVLGAANFPFRSQTTTSVDRIFLYNFTTSLTASYDEIIVDGAPISLASTGSNVSCPSDSNGTVTVIPSGGTAPYSYSWSNNANTATVNNLLPGTYFVTVTDSLGCTNIDSAVVGSPIALATSVQPTDLLCNGDSSGTIDLSVSGGSAPYTYSWSNGAPSEDLANLPTGTYTVTITDSVGCTTTSNATIAEPAAILLNPVLYQPFCNGDSSGSILLSPTGGVPGFNYTWSTSASSQNLVGLAAGQYSVFVTDSNGCSVGMPFTLTEPAAIMLSATVTPVSVGSGAIDLTVAGGVGSYTYAWSNTAVTEDLSGLSIGTYTVTVTDANGCTATDSFVVDATIGVEPGIAGPDVQVFPNPTNGQVRVLADLQAAGTVRLQLSDLTGRIFFSQEVEASANVLETTLTLEDLAAGVYLLGVEAEGRQTWTRVVKE